MGRVARLAGTNENILRYLVPLPFIPIIPKGLPSDWLIHWVLRRCGWRDCMLWKAGEYIYSVPELDLSGGNAPTWLVRMAKILKGGR